MEPEPHPSSGKISILDTVNLIDILGHKDAFGGNAGMVGNIETLLRTRRPDEVNAGEDFDRGFPAPRRWDCLKLFMSKVTENLGPELSGRHFGNRERW
ncbi:hypothetical protein DL766_005749 [Monosporascus sp. MC13-8B]|uniref:Uncharacterized protein n=1 Tax=Monosporascus cannonballus TaxID=155416 RepID=A0ABY0GV24_9PEZI|nr:hypothetical protein DL762_009162 [Monosporascus cannonballus]RYO96548.1 hypothetical protein DL763_003167 [Monosporascus cannonballus]RYP28649.1 hypothetical protein DL766_005749 [Monosporascus sp. MC13-8B]